MMHNVELNSLGKLSKANEPVDIIVEALEGDIYIASLKEQNTTFRITEDGEPLITHSLERMREKMQNIDKASFNLIMTAPYDEMIGIQPSASQSSLMPL